MAARAGGPEQEGEIEERKKGTYRKKTALIATVAIKIIYHIARDSGIPTKVLISSLSHTSRRELILDIGRSTTREQGRFSHFSSESLQ